MARSVGFSRYHFTRGFRAAYGRVRARPGLGQAVLHEKLGFEVRSDVTMGAGFEGAGAGFRWLTVGPPGRPAVEIILAAIGMGHGRDTAEQIRSLVAKARAGVGTDDCQKTFEELSARGVVFTQQPPRGARTGSRPCPATSPATGRSPTRHAA